MIPVFRLPIPAPSVPRRPSSGQERKYAGQYLARGHPGNIFYIPCVFRAASSSFCVAVNYFRKSAGFQQQIERPHPTDPFESFVIGLREYESQFGRQPPPSQIMIFGRIDDHAVQIESAARIICVLFASQLYVLLHRSVLSVCAAPALIFPPGSGSLPNGRPRNPLPAKSVTNRRTEEFESPSFISALIASDSGDVAGTSPNVPNLWTIGRLSGKNDNTYS